MSLHHTFTCPLPGLELQVVVDLGLTQRQYTAGLDAGEYRTVVDILNWNEEWGDKPAFPLTSETIGALPFVLIRYISGGELVGDALDDYWEKRSPK